MDENEKYYEIFRAGNYPQRNVTVEDIKAIAENYDPEFCEAPVSIFHWGNDFAYGWIKDLKVEGEKLMASFKDVTDELKEYVAKKMLKRHSIELYEDLGDKGLYLKGLAMLGKDTPAVKGMQPLQFREAEAVKYDFEELPSFANEFAVEHFRAKADALETEKTKLETDLSQEKTKSQSFASEKEELQFEQRLSNFESFLDEKTEGGQLPPVIRDKALELYKEIHTFPTIKSFEFSEDKQPKIITLFKDMITGLKKQIEFGEEFEDGQTEESLSPHQLADKITAYQEKMKKEGKVVSYSQALTHIKNETNPTK